MTEPDRHAGDEDDDGPTTVARPDDGDDGPTVAIVPGGRRAPDDLPLPPEDTIRVGPQPPSRPVAVASAPAGLAPELPTLRSNLPRALAGLSGPSHDLAPEPDSIHAIPPVIVSSELTPCSPPPDFVPREPVASPAHPAPSIAPLVEATEELSLRDVVPASPAPALPPPSPPAVPLAPDPPALAARPPRPPFALIAACMGFALLVGVGLGALLTHESGDPDVRPSPPASPPAVREVAAVPPASAMPALSAPVPAEPSAPSTAAPERALARPEPSTARSERPPVRPARATAGKRPAQQPRARAAASEARPRASSARSGTRTEHATKHAAAPALPGNGGFVRRNPF